MTDFGADTTLINADQVLLKVASDTYLQLQNINTHFGRPEFREPTTNGGIKYYYGAGENHFTAELLATKAEVDSLNTLTKRTSGNMTETAYTLLCTDKAGNTASVAMTAVLRDFDMSGSAEGAFKFDCFFRITSDAVIVTLA